MKLSTGCQQDFTLCPSDVLPVDDETIPLCFLMSIIAVCYICFNIFSNNIKQIHACKGKYHVLVYLFVRCVMKRKWGLLRNILSTFCMLELLKVTVTFLVTISVGHIIYDRSLIYCVWTDVNKGNNIFKVLLSINRLFFAKLSKAKRVDTQRDLMFCLQKLQDILMKENPFQGVPLFVCLYVLEYVYG